MEAQMVTILAVYDQDPQTPCTTLDENAQRYSGFDGRFYDTVGGPPTEEDIRAYEATQAE
jgi:hypothetical protein